jgi:hypothetical protein
MDGYQVVVFFHVLGAVGLFAAWAIEAAALQQVRRAKTFEEARAVIRVRGRSTALGPAGMLVAVGTGIWMMWDRWGQQPWMAAALVAIAIIVIVGMGMERRAGPRVRRSLANSPASDLRSAIAPLVASLTVRIAVGIGILALMTSKPGATGSAGILAGAIVTGVALAVVFTREGRSPQPSLQSQR